MSALDTARDQLAGLVGRFVEGSPPGSTRQTVTVATSVIEVEDFWRDPNRLSRVLGDFGEVRLRNPDRYDWHLTAGNVDTVWTARLESAPGSLRFTDGGRHSIAISYRRAPGHLGTEMTLAAQLPAPGLLTGAAAFAVLYRARALLQTGEIPTLGRNPNGSQAKAGR